jgi:hypothetical protein
MLLFVIGLVASVPLAIAANLLTPVVQTALAGRSAARRANRIAALQEELGLLARLRDQPSAAAAWLLRKLGWLVAWMGGTVISVGVLIALTSAKPQPSLPSQLAVVCLTLLFWTSAITRVLDMSAECRKIYSPEGYDARVAAQLLKLGAGPGRGAPSPEAAR